MTSSPVTSRPGSGGARTLDGGASRLWAWGPAWACMTLIFAASSVSQPPPEVERLDDGVWHGLVYALLAALMLRGLAAGRWRQVSGRTALLAVALATLYGLTDEWHQSFVPGRTPEVADLIANFTGAAVACGVAWAWRIGGAPGRAGRREERVS